MSVSARVVWCLLLLLPCQAWGGSSCAPRDVVYMLGDGGLMQPSIVTSASRTFAMQQHASRVCENNSVIPCDRIGVQFNTLQNVRIGNAGSSPYFTDLQEYRITAERTFWDGCCSWELIVPIYNTSDNRVIGADEFLRGPSNSGEFGDLAFGVKSLLWSDTCWAWSGGLRVEAPTARDPVIEVFPPVIDSSLDLDAWSLTPWIGGQWTPCSPWFASGFLSYRLNTDEMANYRSDLGGEVYQIDLPTYLSVDVAVGRRLFSDPGGRFLRSLSTALEMHYTTTPTSATPSTLANINRSGQVLGATDYLNLTVGLSGMVSDCYQVGAGFAFPLRSTMNTSPLYETDQTFDWAFFLQLNRFVW